MSDVVDTAPGDAPRPRSFPLEGEPPSAPGLREPVAVTRDELRRAYPRRRVGRRPLVRAGLLVTAGERLFQLDLLLRASTGRLSEVFADRTLDDDRFARTIGFHRAGARLAAGWDDVSRSMHARFREGCAAWIAQMPAPPVEYSLLDMPPGVPTDDAGSWAAAFVYLAWGLSGNWDKSPRTAIGERLGPEAVRTLLPPLPSDLPHIPAGSLGGRLLDDLPRPKGEGSNDWVVSGCAFDDREAAPGERPAPARDPARRVDRDAPPRSGVRGARRGAHRSRPVSCSARPRTTRGASRTSRATCRTSTSNA